MARVDRRTHLALYGNVALKRAYCEVCQTNAFVIGGKLQCCDRPYDTKPEVIRRESQPAPKRRRPGLTEQRAILEAQDYSCIYCQQRFDSIRYRGKKPFKLRIHWDHSVPFAHTMNNRVENFVAACHVCNPLKSDKIFDSLDDARVYLHTARLGKGYDF